MKKNSHFLTFCQKSPKNPYRECRKWPKMTFFGPENDPKMHVFWHPFWGPGHIPTNTRDLRKEDAGTSKSVRNGSKKGSEMVQNDTFFDTFPPHCSFGPAPNKQGVYVHHPGVWKNPKMTQNRLKTPPISSQNTPISSQNTTNFEPKTPISGPKVH